MQITNVSPESLIEYAFNNRKHSDEQIDLIANSIKDFGFNQPIVVDEDNIILVGHGRLRAAKKLELTEVPVFKVVGLSEIQKRAYRILDNKIQNDSEWDFDKLNIELPFLETEGFDLEAWGLDDLLLEAEPEIEVKDDEFEPTEQTETYIKVGDLIELGRHRVLCGDSLLLESWQNADICFTSPPYNRGDSVKLANKKMGKSSYLNYSDNLKDGDYREFLGKITINSISKCKCSAINLQLLSGNKIDLICWLDDFHENFVDVLIWNKRLAAPAAAERVVNSAFEFVFIFSPEDMPSRAIPTANFHGDVSNVINIDPSRSLENANVHAATMPITFAAECLKILGGKTIIDPFLGSGTTLIAADQLGRICYGMEIEPKYCQVIIERYKNHCEKNEKEFVCKVNGKAFDFPN